ncbi:hypothetical protein [Paraburkholderia kirstenboschensis]|uniref:hypothetical protein n=1 Tax=Paraburkholderia kirstenboschensis TaxID=1245436 RepID=UPI000B100DC7|nr:hypothetical protein [Paraburkholderia kirstenboschensis]
MPSGMRSRDLKGSASNQFVADDTPGELQAQVRDIINYICAALIYGNQVYEHRVIVGWWKVFERVRSAWQKR